MILPGKWGQGQIFAFSALDGTSLASTDFTGLLSGDRIGIRFFAKIKRELAIVNVHGRDLQFDAVTSDYICFHTETNEKMRILYILPHLIIGNVCGDALPVVFTEGSFASEYVDDIHIQNTSDGEYTAIGQNGNRFAFAYGHSQTEVLSLIQKGFSLDMEEEEQKKLLPYEKYCLDKTHPYAELYAKCLSVMKSQLYSPEGNFKTIWSTPDRLPHKHLWLWDSVFHAIGHRHISTQLAEELIYSIFTYQVEDGFIPHMSTLQKGSQITQPPVIAWGAWQLYKNTGNKEFLRQIFEKNGRFLAWCRQNRRLSDAELYTWNTTQDKHCRCDESGMDNSPRFDVQSPLYAIDFSCFMANEMRYMQKIALELGDAENALFYNNQFSAIAQSINHMLWSPEDQFYYDYNIETKQLHKVCSIASFLPLFAGICSEDQAASLVKHLKNPETFYTKFPIPSISMKDPTFGSDMWRGPVWINYNYMLTQGLTSYGYEEFAAEIVNKTIYHMNLWYQRTGTIFEFYDCNSEKTPASLNRKGQPLEPYNINIRLQSIRDYGWSSTLLFDWLHCKSNSPYCFSGNIGV